MAKKIKTALPPNVELGGSWVIEWDAVDPTTGASVAGVKVSDTSLLVASAGGPLPDISNPILIGAGAA